MKSIKNLILSLVVTVLSFASIITSTETIFAANQNTETSVSAQAHVEYVYIGNHLYAVTYDTDGKVVMMEPID
jgi:hypothetical protein